MLVLCLDQDQSKEVVRELHEGICGGNFTTHMTTNKILRTGYYWPTLFRDAHAYKRKCEACQKFSDKLKFAGVFLLRPVHVEAPFY